jgi:hypothetical protein
MGFEPTTAWSTTRTLGSCGARTPMFAALQCSPITLGSLNYVPGDVPSLLTSVPPSPGSRVTMTTYPA